jgi:hypothetical protein
VLSSPSFPCLPNRKGHTIMSKPVNYISRFIRWILPLMVLLLIALYLVLSPGLFTRAAGPAMHHNVAAPHAVGPKASPDMFWPLQ